MSSPASDVGAAAAFDGVFRRGEQAGQALGRLGHPVRHHGQVHLVEYDRLGARIKSVGEWQLEYDRAGSRMRAIGPYAIEYDRLGSRPVVVGQMTIEYDRLGNRPRRVVVPDGGDSLDGEQLVAIFVVLYERWRLELDERRRRKK